MSKPTKTSEGPIRIYQWITDDTASEPVIIPQYHAVLVQVDGDLAGGEVIIRAGVEKPTVALEVIRSTPALVVLPGVRVIQPEAPAGIAITVMGTP